MQILTWNREDYTNTVKDDTGTDRTFVKYYMNVVIWFFPDNYTIDFGDDETFNTKVYDEDNNLVEHICDINSTNTFHYTNAPDMPSEFEARKFIYTNDDGWQLKPADIDPTKDE
tara:strand:+ start:134 stop:475 length:342 start_codon:yes stop_codon:yes gene_type:complete